VLPRDASVPVEAPDTGGRKDLPVQVQGGRKVVPVQAPESGGRKEVPVLAQGGRKFRFAELFAGEAGFTRSVKRRDNITILASEDFWSDWDVTVDSDFEFALGWSGETDFIHFAPPCGTFSAARRTDQYGKVEVLRSPERPEGFGHPLAEEANLIASRAAALCTKLYDRKRFFSVENPASSLLWELKAFKKLRGLPDVSFLVLDQCAYGAEHRKPTGILTNAPWMRSVSLQCQDVAPHSHVSLVGKTWDFRSNRTVWRTALAAEYPDGLCEAWASALAEWVSKEWPALLEGESFSRTGRWGNVLVRNSCKRSHSLRDEIAPGSFLPTQEGLSKRDIRELENQQFPGGLRNPNRAVAKSSGLRSVGTRLRGVLESFIQKHPAATSVLDQLGKEDAPGFPDELVWELRRSLAAEFRISVQEEFSNLKSYWVELWASLVSLSGDPDVALPRWLGDGFPLGIEREIQYCGVFPPVDSDSASVEASKVFGKLLAANPVSLEAHKNYESFYEECELAEEDLKRVVDSGYASRHESLQELRTELLGQDPVPAKLAVIVKELPDSSKKVRLIVDMLRNGTNGLIKIPERVVLPRVSDAAESILDLWESIPEPYGRLDDPESRSVELCVLDFKDAFYTLFTHRSEWKYVVATGLLAWYSFKCVAFGLACGPLLWGRLAALAARLAQAIFFPQELRMQVFVDDPVIAVAGTRDERYTLITMLLLFWAALGFRFSWKKGQLGATVQWIGAELALLPGGVRVALSERKTSEVLEALEKVEGSKGMISLTEAMSLIGKISWVASLIPLARPWVGQMYSALIDSRKAPVRSTTRKRPNLVFVRRFSHSVKWLRALVGRPDRLSRSYTLKARRGAPRFAFRTDASPWGLGGVLYAEGSKPIAYWADELSELDLERFNASLGDPAFQSEWELLAVLISLRVFAPWIRGSKSQLEIQSDSSAAIGVTMKLASPSVIMNALAAEIALDLDELEIEVVTSRHVPGTLNFVADALSRLSKGAVVPESLAGVRRVPCPQRTAEFYKAWG
jgi:hypothetical protein